MVKNISAWDIIDEHIYEVFRIFDIRRSRRVNPRTKQAVDFVLMRGFDWVNVIPFTTDGKIVLVEQYRHGIDEWTVEIPGGVIEEGDSPEQAALRELKEETGFFSNQIEHLGTVAANPAMQEMRCHCFVARDVTPTGNQMLDPGEDIRIVIKPVAEVLTLLNKGKISHALVVAAFGLLALNRIDSIS